MEPFDVLVEEALEHQTGEEDFHDPTPVSPTLTPDQCLIAFARIQSIAD
jgi:hypothetical protein